MLSAGGLHARLSVNAVREDVEFLTTMSRTLAPAHACLADLRAYLRVAPKSKRRRQPGAEAVGGELL